MAIFRVGVDCPMGGRPEIEGDAQSAFDAAAEGVAGLKERCDRIDAATDDGANAMGKERAKMKERLAKQERFDRGKALLARHETSLGVFDAELRRDAGLTAPPSESAASIRHGEIRAAYKAMSASERNAVIHHGDKESLLSLAHSPGVLNLITDQERSVIEGRVLEATDGKRYAALQARRTAHGQASYAVTTAERWADSVSGVPAQALRERIAELHKNRK